MRHALDVEHTTGVVALLGLRANPESPASVAVNRPSDVLVARVAVAQTATVLLLEASGSEEANAGVPRSTKIASVGMSFIALLRGIAPTNPNMRNDRLRGVFEDLGFSNVRTVLSSGNVLFESHASAVRALETKVEEALPKRLGFTSTTIIRSRTQIQALVDQDLFGGVDHSSKTNLNVAFLKRKSRPALTFPYQPQDRDYTILGMTDQGRRRSHQ